MKHMNQYKRGGSSPNTACKGGLRVGGSAAAGCRQWRKAAARLGKPCRTRPIIVRALRGLREPYPRGGPMPSPETAAAQRIGTAEMASLPVVLSVSTATAAATVRQLLPEASAPPSLGRANGMVSSLACNGRAQTAQWLLPVRQVP